MLHSLDSLMDFPGPWLSFESALVPLGHFTKPRK